ncbi:hypothetical protein [uncultured Alistipes sp.]|uniref:hypothetical protein n=1 Tax=uncultured Alistipes sp. TaxID=538949 RepID=UPI00262534BF|nr:hypothetical protein [uncultured Alistipes sp.]
MKKNLSLFLVALFGATLLPSCNNDDTGDDEIQKLTLEAVVTDANYEGFSILWTPSEFCDHIEYAVVLSVDEKKAKGEFEAGTLSSIETLTPTSEEIFIPCEGIGPYTVFSRAVAASGTKGNVVTTYATASPAGVLMSGYDAILVDLKVAIYDTEKYDKVGAMIVAVDVLPEIGMTLEELMTLYYGAGMVPVFSNGEEFKPVLNGSPDYAYYMAIAAVGKDGSLDVSSYEFVSPPFDPSLPTPGQMSLEIKEVTENTARMVYTMGENTRCYYAAAMTVESYNEFFEYVPDTYDSPEEYLRDYVAFFGSALYEDDDSVWPSLTPGTDFKALCYPMNGNGHEGYGPETIVDFSTAQSTTTTSVASFPDPQQINLILPVSKNNRTVRPITSAEQVRKLMR